MWIYYFLIAHDTLYSVLECWSHTYSNIYFRHNYDKEVKAQQLAQKQKQIKSKKPDLQTYVPAPKRNASSYGRENKIVDTKTATISVFCFVLF